MKRFLTFFAFISVAIILASNAVPVVKAESFINDEHLTRIRSNCIAAQSLLRQLHTSDALLRVNRGQLYELISTKLMAPLNSRISLGKLDGVSLVSITVQYEQQLDTFRASYQQYESAMSHTLTVNCANQPAEFYASVEDARSKRNQVHGSVVELQKTIMQYQSEFELFAGKVTE